MQGKNYLYIIIFLILSVQISAQIGGRYAFEWLGSPQSPRITALGGSLIAVIDEDVSLSGGNPALLNDRTHNRLSVNHNFAFAGVSNGYIGYGRKWKKYDLNTHISVNYLNLGEFTRADEYGNELGTFTGGETSVTIGASRHINERMTAGINLKGVFGSMEQYNALGAGVDLGLTYRRPESDFILAFVVKNLGYQLTAYGHTKRGLPLDIQIGFSQKLRHLPFRFSITAHQLQKWNVRYDDPNANNDDPLFGDPISPPSTLEIGLDNFFRHFIINGEFLIGKKQGLKLRFGYNHLRRRELSLTDFRSLAGFSAGFGVRIKGFNLDYGVGYYHLSGAANHLSVSTDLSRFFKKS